MVKAYPNDVYTSRAFSWPTRPDAMGNALPVSSHPKPLICVWAAILAALVVDCTSSI